LIFRLLAINANSDSTPCTRDIDAVVKGRVVLRGEAVLLRRAEIGLSGHDAVDSGLGKLEVGGNCADAAAIFVEFANLAACPQSPSAGQVAFLASVRVQDPRLHARK